MSSSSTVRRSSSAPIFSRSGRIRSTITAPTGCRSGRCACLRPRSCSSSATERRGSSRRISRSSSTSRKNSFRREIYPPYKSHRPDPPADLVPQFPLMRETVTRLRHDPGRAGPLRGRRSHRDLCASGARGGRRRPDRLGRQGPDAAHRAGSGDVRPGFGPSWGCRLSRGAAHRRRGSHRVFRRSVRTRSSTSRRSPAIRPTTFRARPASASRRRPSSSANTATSRRCWRGRARSSSRSGARR